MNYGNTEKFLYVKVHGKRVTPVQNLIDGLGNHAATVTLTGNGHALYVLPAR